MNAERPGPFPLGLVAFMATVAMLFTAFTASFLIRRTSPDWKPVMLPPLVFWNLLVLVAGSAALETARRNRSMLAATAAFGMAFLGLQFLAFRQLADAGVFLTSSPHASFLFMLAGVHAAHLVGGLVAVGFAFVKPSRVGACAVYWHFLGGVWIYAVALLSLG